MTTPSPSESLGIDLEHPLPATRAVVLGLGMVHLLGAWCGAGRLTLLESLVLGRPSWLRIAAGGQAAGLIDAGQWWRLATSVWVHADLLHLGLNAVAVLALGRILEPWLGSARLLAWFGLGGSLASLASHQAGVSVSDGASGGAFALLGAVIALGLRWRRRLAPPDARLLGPVLWGLTGLNLAISFLVPRIDAVAHLAGLSVGVALGATGQPGPRTSAFVAGAFVVVCVWGWTLGPPRGW